MQKKEVIVSQHFSERVGQKSKPDKIGKIVAPWIWGNNDRPANLQPFNRQFVGVVLLTKTLKNDEFTHFKELQGNSLDVSQDLPLRKKTLSFFRVTRLFTTPSPNFHPSTFYSQY